jgi:hypothetical protein
MTSPTTLNQNLFEVIVADAKAKAVDHPRWVRAIERAAEFLTSSPYWNYSQGELLVLSDSGTIYRANGVCGCRAFELRQACWHRAGAKLLKRYLEVEMRFAA